MHELMIGIESCMNFFQGYNFLALIRG